MTDILVGLAFFGMVLSPCLVAMATGIPAGAELGVKDCTEPGPGDSGRRHIPG